MKTQKPEEKEVDKIVGTEKIQLVVDGVAGAYKLAEKDPGHLMCGGCAFQQNTDGEGSACFRARNLLECGFQVYRKVEEQVTEANVLEYSLDKGFAPIKYDTKLSKKAIIDHFHDVVDEYNTVVAECISLKHYGEEYPKLKVISTRVNAENIRLKQEFEQLKSQLELKEKREKVLEERVAEEKEKWIELQQRLLNIHTVTETAYKASDKLPDERLLPLVWVSLNYVNQLALLDLRILREEADPKKGKDNG